MYFCTIGFRYIRKRKYPNYFSISFFKQIFYNILVILLLLLLLLLRSLWIMLERSALVRPSACPQMQTLYERYARLARSATSKRSSAWWATWPQAVLAHCPLYAILTKRAPWVFSFYFVYYTNPNSFWSFLVWSLKFYWFYFVFWSVN